MTNNELDANKIYAAGESYYECGQFSIANPTTSLKDNPHNKITSKLHRAATGAERTMWACEDCNYVLPRTKNPIETDGKIKSACCDADIYICHE